MYASAFTLRERERNSINGRHFDRENPGRYSHAHAVGAAKGVDDRVRPAMVATANLSERLRIESEVQVLFLVVGEQSLRGLDVPCSQCAYRK
jgi:hypothetical protein